MSRDRGVLLADGSVTTAFTHRDRSVLLADGSVTTAFTHGMRNEMPPLAEGPSQARSMLSLFAGKRPGISLPDGNTRAMKDALKPIFCSQYGL